MKREWRNPKFNVLGVSLTENNQHNALEILDLNDKSTWKCSCGNIFNSYEELNKHVNEFWNGSQLPGTEHGEVKIS